MTNEQKAQAYLMKLDGMSLEEIGQHFGVTRERIRQVIPAPPDEIRGQYRAKQRSKYDDMIYPALAQWLYDHRFTFSRFAHEIGRTESSVGRWFKGKNEMPKSAIDAILKRTGLTYEEAFLKDEDSSELLKDCG